MKAKIILLCFFFTLSFYLLSQENLAERQCMISMEFDASVSFSDSMLFHDQFFTDFSSRVSSSLFDYNGSNGFNFEQIYDSARKLGCDIFIYLRIYKRQSSLSVDYYIYDILTQNEIAEASEIESELIVSDILNNNISAFKAVSRRSLEQLYINDTIVKKGVVLTIKTVPGTVIDGFQNEIIAVNDNGFYTIELEQYSSYKITLYIPNETPYKQELFMGTQNKELLIYPDTNRPRNKLAFTFHSGDYLTGAQWWMDIYKNQLFAGAGIYQSYLFPKYPFFASSNYLEEYDYADTKLRNIELKAGIENKILELGETADFFIGIDAGTTLWTPADVPSIDTGSSISIHPFFGSFLSINLKSEFRIHETSYFTMCLSSRIYYIPDMSTFNTYITNGGQYPFWLAPQVNTSDNSSLIFSLVNPFFGVTTYF